jgi:hypothetical protein
VFFPVLLVFDTISRLFVCLHFGLWENHVHCDATFNLWGWFLLTRAACIQGYLPVVPVSNSKFMEWLCYVLGWSWSLLRACGNDFTLLFYPVILWWLGKSDLTYSYNCTHISCALKRLEQFRCCMPLTHRTWWHFWDLCLHSISFSSNLFDDPSD